MDDPLCPSAHSITIACVLFSTKTYPQSSTLPSSKILSMDVWNSKFTTVLGMAEWISLNSRLLRSLHGLLYRCIHGRRNIQHPIFSTVLRHTAEHWHASVYVEGFSRRCAEDGVHVRRTFQIQQPSSWYNCNRIKVCHFSLLQRRWHPLQRCLEGLGHYRCDLRSSPLAPGSSPVTSYLFVCNAVLLCCLDVVGMNTTLQWIFYVLHMMLHITSQ